MVSEPFIKNLFVEHILVNAKSGLIMILGIVVAKSGQNRYISEVGLKKLRHRLVNMHQLIVALLLLYEW